jgi:hypothetical protein
MLERTGRVIHAGERAVGDNGAIYAGSGVAGRTWRDGTSSELASVGNGVAAETPLGVGKSAGTGGTGDPERPVCIVRKEGLFDRFVGVAAWPKVLRLPLSGTFPMMTVPEALDFESTDLSRTVGSSSRDRERMDASE